MTKWFQWVVLTSITGSPLLSIVILVVFWWALDQYSLRLLPNPVRWLRVLQRMFRLERELLNNPHDRRARRDLAELYVAQKRHAKAVAILRPAIEAGDEDPPTLYLFGLACLGAGHSAQGEQILSAVADHDPQFRMGEIDLELGRDRLRRGDAKGAIEPLERFVRVRRSTVEGRTLLARALERSGDDGKGALMRAEAWREYRGSPGFQRRVERYWAWRAKPSRPVMYAAALILVGFAFSQFVAPKIAPAMQPNAHAAPADPYLADDAGP